MAADPSIGTRIQRRRQALRMTQEELAGQLGVAKSTIANWETGKHFPKRHLGAVESALGIRLTGGSESDSIEKLAADVASSRDLTERQKQMLLTLIHRDGQR